MLVVEAAARSKAVIFCLLLFVVAPIICGCLMPWPRGYKT